MSSSFLEISLKIHLCIGFIVRLLLIVYSKWQDLYFDVKFTDIDYSVFSDAAVYVSEGRSPYDRATYRYTPLLSWILLPNTVFSSFGKILFSSLDIICASLIYKIILRHLDHRTALIMSFLWIYNPLSVIISTRGSAESIMVVLVLCVFYFIQIDEIILAAIFYGLAVHVKIYPVIFSLPLYLHLGDALEFDNFGKFVRSVLPNSTRLKFVVTSVSVFTGLTSLFYYCYGFEFIQETYLYHVTRQDTRHNFSPYFYLLYLSGGLDWSGKLGLVLFIPQAFLLVYLSVYYYHDLPLCCFLQTFIFVAFNKVCTSQYFLWYVSLVPVIAPQLRFDVKHALKLVTIWFFGQGLWLLPAYLLEFHGWSTFLAIWMAGIVFFLINIFIAGQIIVHHRDGSSIKSQ